MHVVESAGGNQHLWGKENVIASLMESQRASGVVTPELVTFTPCLLSSAMMRAGFPVHILDTKHRRFPIYAANQLRSLLALGPAAVVHTHEYKANIIGRILRATRTPMKKLVSTCHGWVDRSPQLDVYFAVDRATAFGSDIVTVTDPAMMKRFFSSLQRVLPLHLEYVQNGVKNYPMPTPDERLHARKKFGFPDNVTVIGSLGRLTENKGILDILQAAERTQNNKDIIWAIAGSGALKETVEQ